MAILDHAYTQFLSELNLNDIKDTKIIIDVSNWSDTTNNSNNKQRVSNAEKLANLVKKYEKINVVKGFNLINAYSMLNNNNLIPKDGIMDKIPIASDDQDSKELTKKLCNRLGFEGVDIGPLRNALLLEKSNIKTFEEWKYPFLLSSLFFAFNFVWIFTIYFYFPKGFTSLFIHIFVTFVLILFHFKIATYI